MNQPKINTDAWHFKFLARSHAPNYIIRQTRSMSHYWRMVASKVFRLFVLLPLFVVGGILFVGAFFSAPNDLVLETILKQSLTGLLILFGKGLAFTVGGVIVGGIFLVALLFIFHLFDTHWKPRPANPDKVPTFFSKKTGKIKDTGF